MIASPMSSAYSIVRIVATDLLKIGLDLRRAEQVTRNRAVSTPPAQHWLMPLTAHLLAP